MKKNIILAAAFLTYFSAGHAAKNFPIISISPHSLPPGLERNANAKYPRGLAGKTPRGWDKGQKNGWKKDRYGDGDYSIHFNLGRD